MRPQAIYTDSQFTVDCDGTGGTIVCVGGAELKVGVGGGAESIDGVGDGSVLIGVVVGGGSAGVVGGGGGSLIVVGLPAGPEQTSPMGQHPMTLLLPSVHTVLHPHILQTIET